MNTLRQRTPGRPGRLPRRAPPGRAWRCLALPGLPGAASPCALAAAAEQRNKCTVAAGDLRPACGRPSESAPAPALENSLRAPAIVSGMPRGRDGRRAGRAGGRCWAGTGRVVAGEQRACHSGHGGPADPGEPRRATPGMHHFPRPTRAAAGSSLCVRKYGDANSWSSRTPRRCPRCPRCRGTAGAMALPAGRGAGRGSKFGSDRPRPAQAGYPPPSTPSIHLVRRGTGPDCQRVFNQPLCSRCYLPQQPPSSPLPSYVQIDRAYYITINSRRRPRRHRATRRGAARRVVR